MRASAASSSGSDELGVTRGSARGGRARAGSSDRSAPAPIPTAPHRRATCPGIHGRRHAAADQPCAARDRALHRARRALCAATDRARDEAPKDVVGGRRCTKAHVVAVEEPRLRRQSVVAEPDGERPAGCPPVADALLVVGDVLQRLGERDVAREVERRADDGSERRRAATELAARSSGDVEYGVT